MNWRDRPVLVTGAGGFIGSHLVEELVALRACVRALVRYDSQGTLRNLGRLAPEVLEQVEVVRGDVTDGYQMRSFVDGMDTVFHLAALVGIPYSYVAPQAYVDVNVRGTLHLLEGCRAVAARRLVHVSSSEVYGTARYEPMDEDHPRQPQSPYAATKIGADCLVESYARSFGQPVTIVRPFNNFGPRQSLRAVIPTIIAQAAGSDRIRLGSLEPVRDFLFVKDTVRGLVATAASEACVGETVNLGTGRGISVGDLVALVLSLMDVSRPVEPAPERRRPERSEVMRLICCADKAKRLAGWKPAWTLEQGLQVTIAETTATADGASPSAYRV